MLEFLSSLQWYEWIFGGIAALLVFGVVGYIMMGLLAMSFIMFVMNETFRNWAIAIILGSSALYLILLVMRHT